MPRPKGPNTTRDRSRKPVDISPVLVRRPTLARALDLTEGTIRNFELRGIGPKPIRLEGSRIVLHDLNEWISYLRRCAA